MVGLGRREIGRAHPEDRVEQSGIAHEGEAAVVWDVQPFMSVGDHRIGPLNALRQVSRDRRHPREEPEGAVDVQPGVMTMGQVGHCGDRIEAASVHLARCRDHDCRRTLQRLERLIQRGQIDAPDRIPAQHPNHFVADPEHAQRLFRRGVDEAAGQHRHRRQAAHPTIRDVRCVLFSPPLAGRGQGREVRHRGAGGQDAAPAGRKAEEILQPADGDLLELGTERRADPQSRVVIEGRGEPVRRKRSRRRTTGDEVEEARAGRVGRGLDAVRQEAGQRRQTTVSVLRQLAHETVGSFVASRAAARGQLIDSGKVTSGGFGHLG